MEKRGQRKNWNRGEYNFLIDSDLELYKNNKKDYFYGMAQQTDHFKKVISHAKEYGFVFPSSEIYDGLSAVYDYAQNGSALKK